MVGQRRVNLFDFAFRAYLSFFSGVEWIVRVSITNSFEGRNFAGYFLFFAKKCHFYHHHV